MSVVTILPLLSHSALFLWVKNWYDNGAAPTDFDALQQLTSTALQRRKCGD